MIPQCRHKLIWQDLYNDKVRGIDKESEALYLLKEKRVKRLVSTVKNEGRAGDLSWIWHMRLGHASTAVLQHIPFLKNKVDNSLHNKCSVCPMAKQSRLSFTNSE